MDEKSCCLENNTQQRKAVCKVMDGRVAVWRNSSSVTEMHTVWCIMDRTVLCGETQCMLMNGKFSCVEKESVWCVVVKYFFCACRSTPSVAEGTDLLCG
jgi:hypothetical protein